MKHRFIIPLRKILLAAAILAATCSIIPAATLWTGPNTNFAQTSFTSPPKADVLVSGKVSLTRNFSHWLYNTNKENGAGVSSPSDTEWAFGDLADYNTLTYQSFSSFRDGNLSGVLVPVPGQATKPMVCHLINEDIYLQITFTAWPQGGGFIAYTRSTPAALAPPPPTPAVGITNPASGAVFATPANVKIFANASVSSGTVTNVTFFNGSSPLGSKQAAPFVITNSLAVGSYNLTAVATAAGISATSSVVNISVVAPAETSLSGASTLPAGAASDQFVFGYTVTPGLSYVVEGSSNLINWTPLMTNVPSSSPAFFTNPVSAGDDYFRVGRQPNP